MHTGGGFEKAIVRGDDPSMAGHAGSRETAVVVEVVVVVVVVRSAVVAGIEGSVDVVVVMSPGRPVVVASVDAAASVVIDGSVVVGSADSGATPPAPVASEPFAVLEESVLVLPGPVAVASGAEPFTPTVTTASRWL